MWMTVQRTWHKDRDGTVKCGVPLQKGPKIAEAFEAPKTALEEP